MAGGEKLQIIRIVMDTSEATRSARKFDAEEKARIKGRSDAEKQAAKARADADKQAARESTRAQKDVDRMFAAAQREHTREKAQAIRQQAAALQAAKRKEKMEMDTAHKHEMTQWKLKQKSMQEEEAATHRNKAAVLGYLGAFAGIGGVITGVQAIAQYWDDIRRDTIEATKETIHFREVVMELAAMKGELGKTGPEVGRQLELIAQTGQTADDSLAMSTHAAGAAEAAIGKNITREDYDKGYIAAAKLQAMEGPKAGAAYGDLYGTLAVEAPKGTTGDQMAARMNKEFRIASLGKFASMGEYAKQRQEVSGYVQNGMMTADEAAGLLSGASLAGNPQEAATHLRQGIASLSADSMRMRKMKMMPGQEQETSADYFQKHLGLDIKHTTSMQKLRAVENDLMKAEKDTLERGETWDAHRYLISHGVNNQQAREFYQDRVALRKGGTGASVEERMNEKDDPNAIGNQFKERIGREPVLQDRLAKAASKAATIKRGSGTAEGALMSVQEAAFNKLWGDKKIQGTFEEWKNRGSVGKAYDNMFGGYHSQVDVEAQKMLVASARKSGMDTKSIHKALGITMYQQEGQYQGDEKNFALQQEIQAAGGNPLEGVADQAKETNMILKRIEQKLAGPAAVAAPGKGPSALNMPPKQLSGIRQAMSI